MSDNGKNPVFPIVTQRRQNPLESTNWCIQENLPSVTFAAWVVNLDIHVEKPVFNRLIYVTVYIGTICI
jgi:hypothetical protein